MRDEREDDIFDQEELVEHEPKIKKKTKVIEHQKNKNTQDISHQQQPLLDQKTISSENTGNQHQEIANTMQPLKKEEKSQTMNSGKTKKKISSKCYLCRKSGKLLHCLCCPRSFHQKCLGIDRSKKIKKYTCDKCKEKARMQLKKKKQKEKDKNNKKNTDILKSSEFLFDDLKFTISSDKIQQFISEKRKKFEQFVKYYPQYILNGKVKFPIEDSLFKEYNSLFEDKKQIIQQKPKGKEH